MSRYRVASSLDDRSFHDLLTVKWLHIILQIIRYDLDNGWQPQSIFSIYLTNCDCLQRDSDCLRLKTKCDWIVLNTNTQALDQIVIAFKKRNASRLLQGGLVWIEKPAVDWKESNEECQVHPHVPSHARNIVRYKYTRDLLGTSQYGIVCHLWMNDRKIFLKNNHQLILRRVAKIYGDCEGIPVNSKRDIEPLICCMLYATSLWERGDQKESRSFLRLTWKHLRSVR